VPVRLVRTLAALAVLIACLAAVDPSAAPAALGGAQLTVLASRTHKSLPEILVVGPYGQVLSSIAGATGAGNAEWLSWSPDGREYAYIDEGVVPSTVMVARAGAPEARTVGTSAYESFPVFDPDGEVVFATLELYDRKPGVPDYEPSGIYGTVLWASPVDGSEPRQLFAFGPGALVDPYSAASDGTVAAMQGLEIATLTPGKATLHPVFATDVVGISSPAISPDGSRVVFLRDQLEGFSLESARIGSTQVISVSTRGGKPKVIATIPGGARWPSWDPSGSRLSFTALGLWEKSETDLPGPHSALMEMNPDGSCLTTVYAAKNGGTVWGGAWRPRRGRAVPPLSC